MVGCQKKQDLRGEAEPSADGQTYLVMENDNGGACGPIRVDGKRWTYPVHVRGVITPGRHVIKCGTEIEFEIQPVKNFKYLWLGIICYLMR